MNLTHDIIHDLIPLYAAHECSVDTRAVIEDYLRRHPEEAAGLRQAMTSPALASGPLPQNLDEMEALRRARRQVQFRSWMMAFAIVFSIVPLSFLHLNNGHTYWFFRESPISALIYGGIGIAIWISYFILRHRSKTV
ncbi:MAG: hypothetical protein ACR2NX_13830 [Chthoniobacterales bacterium]